MSDVIPELAEKPSAPPPRRRFRYGFVLAALALVGIWWQRDRIAQFAATQSPAHSALQTERDQLAQEREALAAEVDSLKASNNGSEFLADANFSDAQLLADEIDTLNEQIGSLEAEKTSLHEALSDQDRRAGYEIQKLEARISQLEDLARREREDWKSEESRLLAANENLEKQNALLKDRLSDQLLASIEPADETNAAAALDRGSMRIEKLENRIAALESQLAESGRQRNLLARSLQDTRDQKAATDLTAELSLGAGDRMMTDLSERFAALKRDSESALVEQEKQRAAWQTERGNLVASRDALRADVVRLRAELAALKNGSPSASSGNFAAAPASPSAENETTSSDQDPKPLLIEEPGSLSESARPVFETLQTIDESPGDLPKAYDDISQETGGQLAITIPFPAGSASLDAESRERIRTLVSESPDSRFLAIGYASTDGSQDRNRELSSRRALATAEAIAEARPNHPVEAVYFGQTQRFDLNRRAANRVVEIWKID